MPNLAPRCRKLQAPDSHSGTFRDAQFSDLIDAIALKRQKALTDLYSRTVSQIYPIAYWFLRSKQDAEEIVSDVFLYVWEHTQEYTRERGSVMAWLTTITRNRAIDRLRTRRRYISVNDNARFEGAPFLMADAKHLDEVLTQLQIFSRVRGAMASLSPLRSRLIEMSFFEGLTHEEIAKAMTMPQGTVKSHVRRGLIAIRVAITLESGALAQYAARL